MTEQQRIEAVLERMDHPPVPQDDRPFWKRLVTSVRLSLGLKYSENKIKTQIDVKAGTDF